MKWSVGVLVETRVGARVGVGSLSLVSETMHLASFLSRSPNLRVSLGSEISGRTRDVLL